MPGLRVLRPVLFPRRGRFDSLLVEPGPPAVATDDGIVLLANGANHWEHGDPSLPAVRPTSPARSCSTRSTRRRRSPARPNRSCAPTAPTQHGQVDNVCFAQGLVRFEDRWLLYLGMADSRIGVAVAPAIV